MSRADDVRTENAVAAFLDRYFWTRLGREFERYSDRRHQFAGCDLRLGKAYFGEKAKTCGCLNRPLPVLSFEVQFVNRAGNVQPGWFVAPGLSTDWYAFVNVSADQAGQLSAADVLFVNKEDARGLAGGLDLEREADSLRREGDSSLSWDGKFRRHWDGRDAWLTYSSRLAERPVNFVVPKEALEKLPRSRRMLVTQSGIERI